MNQDELEQIIRQIIREEIAKLNERPVIKDVHLHVHGDKSDAIKLLRDITGIQASILENRVAETLLHTLTE